MSGVSAWAVFAISDDCEWDYEEELAGVFTDYEQAQLIAKALPRWVEPGSQQPRWTKARVQGLGLNAVCLSDPNVAVPTLQDLTALAS